MTMEISKNIQKIRIPLPCPVCDGRMMAVAYFDQSHMIKESSLQVCQDCGFYQFAKDFKDSLLTV